VLGEFGLNPLLNSFVVRALAGEYRFNTDELRRYQDACLCRLVRHAWESVPFYRKLYDEAGVDVRAFRGAEDLERLPVVSRQQLQQTPLEERVARGVDVSGLLLRKTGGSSGVPLTIARTRWEDLFLQSARFPARRALGVRPWHRRARVSLVKRAPTGGVRQIPSARGRGGLFPFRSFDAFADPDTLARQIAEYRPALLSGNPGFLERLCVAAKAELLERIRPRWVMCGGETMQPGVKRLLETAFGAPVFDFYGAHEFNLVAWQRRPGAVFEVASLVTLGEVLGGEGDADAGRRVRVGECGEFVGTALWSYASPFIRYRLGDDVTLAEVDSATGVARGLGGVQGRVTDRFVTRDGQTIHAYEAVTPLLTAMPWLQSYQMVQNAAGELLVRVVPSGAASAERQQAARAELQQMLREKLAVEVEYVEQLLRDGEAKQKLFVRNVPLPAQAQR
jgi:phenylacetate-CoA ligase